MSESVEQKPEHLEANVIASVEENNASEAPTVVTADDDNTEQTAEKDYNTGEKIRTRRSYENENSAAKRQRLLKKETDTWVCF